MFSYCSKEVGLKVVIYLPDATAREAKKQRKYKDGNIYTFQQNFWILFLWFLQTKGFVYVRPIIFSCIYWHIRQITCMNKNMISFYWLPFFPFSVLDWGTILCKWWWNVRKWNIMSELRIHNFFVNDSFLWTLVILFFLLCVSKLLRVEE